MLHILLAEDNPVNQMITKKIIEKLGATVDVANNGKEAVMMVQETNYAFILMDLNMPVMNGLDAAVEIRKLGFDVPIVALTADSEEMTDEIQECGMEYFISKPVSISKIENFIQNFHNTSSEDTVKGCYDYVQEHLGLDKAITKELLGEFLTDSKLHLGYLKEAIDVNNLPKTASEAHYIKGAAHNMGLVNIANLAEIIEKNARNNEQEEYVKLYERLVSKLELLTEDFNKN